MPQDKEPGKTFAHRNQFLGTKNFSSRAKHTQQPLIAADTDTPVRDFGGTEGVVVNHPL